MATVVGTALRSYISDLLPIPRSTNHSDIVVLACRLLGCATIFSVAAGSIRHAGPISASQVFPLSLLVMTVALPVGNLIKELGILIAGIVLNWLGFEFRRTRLAINGARLFELYRPDGTWDRCIKEAAETIHEWSDPGGGCHREVLTGRAPELFQSGATRSSAAAE